VCAVCVGIWLRADVTSSFQQFVDPENEFNFIYSAGYVTICVGIVVSALGVLGICGAIFRNLCILLTVRTRNKKSKLMLMRRSTPCSSFCLQSIARVRLSIKPISHVLFIYLYETWKPSTMPRPWALIGITVHTNQAYDSTKGKA